MPFLRIVRDKRGYEYFSLVHQTSGRRGKVRQQVLYWFRTPPNIKVGRQPLDEEVMRALERQNPDVRFDWEALRDTPPPLPSVEPWRERRRAERAARQLRDADEAPESAAEPEAVVPAMPIDQMDALDLELSVAVATEFSGIAEVALITEVGPPPMPEVTGAGAAGQSRRRRHRRRGRRSHSDGLTGASSQASPPTESATPSSTEHDQPGSSDDDE
ncbi:MAG: hypothetical protein ABJA98_01895 [Acidobacteriota bacterium]